MAGICAFTGTPDQLRSDGNLKELSKIKIVRPAKATTP
jgi:hypothetical protein